MPQTKRLMVQLSGLPCSIIIIGVGNADFSQMQDLDGDDGILRDDTGRGVDRDIVQFVQFNNSARQGNLAEEVLKEVPNQLCGYMERNGIVPQPVAQTMPVVVVNTSAQ